MNQSIFDLQFSDISGVGNAVEQSAHIVLRGAFNYSVNGLNSVINGRNNALVHSRNSLIYGNDNRLFGRIIRSMDIKMLGWAMGRLSVAIRTL